MWSASHFLGSLARTLQTLVICHVANRRLVLTAIGFSYFEKLIDSGDQALIEGEVARLMSFGHMLATVGQYDYFDDWSEYMFTLLREIAESMGNPAVAHLLLLQRWNDNEVTSNIIYYMRLLAGTFLKANAATYDPFIPDGGGIQSYCRTTIEIPNREIEQLGIIALVNMLLKPVNFFLEIAYLDRSPGAQVNQYRFPEEANGQDPSSLGPIIYLLYRPDHYDILYRAPPPESLPVHVPVGPVSMQVNRVTGFTHDTEITSTPSNLSPFSNVDFGALSMIPGFTSSMGGGMATLAPPLSSQVAEPFSPQETTWMPQYQSPMEASTPQPIPHQPTMVAPPQPATPGLQQPMMVNPGLAPGEECNIRFSPMQLDYEESKSNFPEPTFQVKTRPLKNSVFNRAHFGNPDFLPELWSPKSCKKEVRKDGRDE